MIQDQQQYRSTLARDLLTMLAVMATAALFVFYVVPTALERESHRMEVEHETNCRHYGDAMNEWAASRNVQPVCP